LCANSLTDLASFLLIAPSAKNFCREARNKAPLGANNEVNLTTLEEKALHDKAKFASKGRTEAATSLCDATLSGEAILASPITKKKSFKAKSKASQPKDANFQSSRVFVMDRLDLVNADSRDYLNNKRKLHSEEPVHILSS